MTADDFLNHLELDLVPEEVLNEIKSLRYIDAKILAGLAMGLGWHWNRAKALHFTSHDGMKVDIPTNTALNAKVFRSRANTLVRHRDPSTKPFEVVESLIAFPGFKVDHDRARVLREAVASAAQAPPVESTPAPPSSGGNQEPESIPVKARRKRRIIKVEPWSAHRNAKGETYPSEAVWERTWNDGTVDYACRWEGCDYTDDSPHSVAHHNGAHKRGEGTQPQPPVDGFDPTHVSNPRRITRIRNLAREIDGAFGAAFSAGVALDPDWLAQWIIDHRIEALPSDTPVPAEPLSTEEILDRIAALVDRGRGKVLREQVDILQRQVDGYIEERDHLRDTMAQELAEVNARADKAEGYVQALRDLINETTSQQPPS